MELDVTALVLAGGRARRLGGRNKALLQVGGATLLDRLVAELTPRVARVWISLAEPATWTALPALLDPEPDMGPLGGIAAGLAAAPGWLLAVAVDMPYLRGEVLDLLLERARRGGNPDAIAFRLGGLPEPLVALWGKSTACVVSQRLADRRLKVAAALLDPQLHVEWIDEEEVRRVDPELRAFVNVNSVTDAAAL
jgi:molybdopterin-guanine dinucleotide biosynthesis protein A